MPNALSSPPPIAEPEPAPTWVLEAYRPGALAAVVDLHARWYARHWGFGLTFERKVAGGMATFLERWDARRDLFLTAWSAPTPEARFLGSVALDGIDAAGKGAQLRWFITAPEVRGHGLGRALLGEAMAFAGERRYPRAYLWTFEGLHGARHLYEAHGFTLAEERTATTWGPTMNEQRFEWRARGL